MSSDPLDKHKSIVRRAHDNDEKAERTVASIVGCIQDSA